MRARRYCDAGIDAGGGFQMSFLQPFVVGAGVVLGAVMCQAGLLLARRAPVAVRAAVAVLLVVAVTPLPGWWFFAHYGTLDGYPGDSGLCPSSNVPPWWPDWIPA
ncbi:hypothetical protein ACWERV_03940 [Streptomyces sp. NPDC004031]